LIKRKTYESINEFFATKSNLESELAKVVRFRVVVVMCEILQIDVFLVLDQSVAVVFFSGRDKVTCSFLE
jgi:hypothetical protein